MFTKARVTVQPLLTPDKGRNTTMYVDNVLALIKSAKKRLYIQTQYVHPTSLPADRSFMLLVNAVADAVRRKVDVRLICSQYETRRNTSSCCTRPASRACSGAGPGAQQGHRR